MMIDVDHFKAVLTARRAELETLLHRIEDRLDDPKDPDVEERATEREEDEVLETQGNTGLKEIQAIDAALGRIDSGIYGTCLACENPISAERLEAVPTATRCRNCM